jgi:hypothetical protein
VAKVDESKDNNSEGSRNTDNGQHLLLTQPFIPTFSEQMDTLPIFSNLDMDANHMNSLLPKNASEPLYAFANDFILTVNHDVYDENIGTNLPVWTSSSHTAVSDAYSSSGASSSLKMVTWYHFSKNALHEIEFTDIHGTLHD